VILSAGRTDHVVGMVHYR